MADSLQVKLEGVDELLRVLRDAPQKIRIKAVRGALRQGALVIRNQAKLTAPVLQRLTPYRKAGTVKRRISVRPSKFARQAGNEGVFIGVKPLRGKADLRRYGKASAKNPNDPFYWRFLEFGTKKMAARPFLGPAVKSKGEQAIQTFMRQAVPQIEKLNKKAGL